MSVAFAACFAVLILDSLGTDAYVASDEGTLDRLAVVCGGLLVATAAASLRRGHRLAVSSALSLAATALGCATTAWTAMELSHDGAWSWRWLPAWLVLLALRAADARASRWGPTSARRLGVQVALLLVAGALWAEHLRVLEVERRAAREHLQRIIHKRLPSVSSCVVG